MFLQCVPASKLRTYPQKNTKNDNDGCFAIFQSRPFVHASFLVLWGHVATLQYTKYHAKCKHLQTQIIYVYAVYIYKNTYEFVWQCWKPQTHACIDQMLMNHWTLWALCFQTNPYHALLLYFVVDLSSIFSWGCIPTTKWLLQVVNQ